MNARHWLMTSAAVNVALAGGLAWYVLSPATCCAPIEPSPVGQQSAAPALTPTGPAPAKGARVVTITNRVEAGFDWRQVESEDYKEYIANLRTIGCPEATIRDIIIADVDKLFADRRRAMHTASTNKFEYWKMGMEQMFDQAMNEKKIEENKAITDERRNLLTLLLGSPPEEKVDFFQTLTGGVNFDDLFSQVLDFLTPAQRTQVWELEAKFAARENKARGDSDEVLKAKKEKEAELAKLLTPEQLEAFQLRMSPTADRIRSQFASFEPSEQEFIEIYRATKAAEDESGVSNQTKIEAELKSKLGSRYADYERSQSPEYNRLHRVASKHGVSKEATIAVDDMRKIAQNKVLHVWVNSGSREAAMAAMQAIAEETSRSVRQTMGEDAFKAFEKNQGASAWLRNLAQEPQGTGAK